MILLFFIILYLRFFVLCLFFLRAPPLVTSYLLFSHHFFLYYLNQILQFFRFFLAFSFLLSYFFSFIHGWCLNLSFRSIQILPIYILLLFKNSFNDKMNEYNIWEILDKIETVYLNDEYMIRFVLRNNFLNGKMVVIKRDMFFIE